MWSFFKLVVIPSPRTKSFITKLSREQFLKKISSEISNRKLSLGKLAEFTGEVSDYGFEGVYLNTERSLSKSKMVSPVQVKAIHIENSSNEIHLEICLSKSQSFLLRFSNGFILFWWFIWTPLTLVFYPSLLKAEGSVFTSLILMPIGVVLAPLAIYEMKKVPKRSLDCAENYLMKFLSC